jgi:hypothetical protein
MTRPFVEISDTCALECSKVFLVEVVISLVPLLCDGLRAMTSKIMKFAKLFKDGFMIDFEANWIPLNTALPVVTICITIHPSLAHDTLSGHA